LGAASAAAEATPDPPSHAPPRHASAAHDAADLDDGDGGGDGKASSPLHKAAAAAAAAAPVPLQRRAARRTTLLLRALFVLSLLGIAALVAATLGATLVGLEDVFRSERALGLANRVSYRSQAVVSDLFQLQAIVASNTTVSDTVLDDLEYSRARLDYLVHTLLFGNATPAPDATDLDTPVHTPELDVLYAQLETLQQTMDAELAVVLDQVRADPLPPFPPNVTDGIAEVIDAQAALVVVTEEIVATLDELVGTQLAYVRGLVIAMSVVILAVLFFIGVAVFWPIDRRVQCVRTLVDAVGRVRGKVGEGGLTGLVAWGQGARALGRKMVRATSRWS